MNSDKYLANWIWFVVFPGLALAVAGGMVGLAFLLAWVLT